MTKDKKENHAITTLSSILSSSLIIIYPPVNKSCIGKHLDKSSITLRHNCIFIPVLSADNTTSNGCKNNHSSTAYLKCTNKYGFNYVIL